MRKAAKPGKKLFPTPSDCEFAFYDAFERADLNLMMVVWADEPDVVCIHPQGPRLAGFSAIRDSFAAIFSQGPNVQIKISEARHIPGQTLSVHSVYESFLLRAQGATPPQAMPIVLATNVYMLTPNGWRMVLHHASLAPQGTVAAEQGVSRILH